MFEISNKWSHVSAADIIGRLTLVVALSSTSSTVNNMSRPGAPLPAPGLVPVSGAAQLSSGSQWAAASGPAAAASAEPSDATPTAAVLGPPAGAPPSYPAPEVKIRNAPGEPDETEVKRKYSQGAWALLGVVGELDRYQWRGVVD